MISYVIVTILVTAVFIAAILYARANRRFGKMPSSKNAEQLKNLPYYFGGKFHNDESVFLKIKKTDIYKMVLMFFLPQKDFAEVKIDCLKLDSNSFAEKKDGFSVRWLGHSTLIFEMEGLRFMTDPVFGNASPLPFSVKRNVPPPLRREDIPQLDFVIISHDHYDHLEYETVLLLKERGVKFITALGVGARLRGWGVPSSDITELGWGDSAEIGPLSVTAERARHFSGRRPKGDKDKTLWASYVIESENRRVFFGADGGYGSHFAEIGRKYGGFDLACLEIDAWNDRWPHNHMFPEEALKAFADLNGGLLLPIHWGVYNLAMHPWDESIMRVKKAAKETGAPLLELKMGEKKIFN